jgi:hypothetical protein
MVTEVLVREVRKVESDSLVIHMPAELLDEEVEVLVLSTRRNIAGGEGKNGSWPPGFLDRYYGCMPDFPDPEYEGDYEVREPL